jgi:hypothetical protein
MHVNIIGILAGSLSPREPALAGYVFLDNYYLLINKKYLTYIKQTNIIFAQKLC